MESKNQNRINRNASFYADRLAKMIACETVSHKDFYEDKEFAKLREVIKELFPLFTKTAQFQVFGDDCYLYRLPGRDRTRNVMVMSHHDVAPVTGEWKYPPFSGTVAEGCIWGRGTVDTKTPLFAEFTALEELLEEGAVPACNVYLASSHNEEVAGDGIPRAAAWFQEKGITFEWILDEGGAVIDPPMAGIRCRCAMLAVHEKGRHTLELTAVQDNGHSGLSGSTLTPAVRMAQFITHVQKKPPFIRRMHPELKGMFEGLAPHMTFPMSLIFKNLRLFSGLLVKIIPRLNEQAGAMLGTSCTFKELRTDENGDCHAKAFLRCVKEEDLKADITAFHNIAKQYGVTVDDAKEGNEYHPPASLKSKGYHYIKGCVEKQFPYAACAPFILPAGTDARHFCDICDAVIRFAPIDLNKQQFASVHNVDENIRLETVVSAVQFYKELIRGITL